MTGHMAPGDKRKFEIFYDHTYPGFDVATGESRLHRGMPIAGYDHMDGVKTFFAELRRLRRCGPDIDIYIHIEEAAKKEVLL